MYELFAAFMIGGTIAIISYWHGYYKGEKRALRDADKAHQKYAER